MKLGVSTEWSYRGLRTIVLENELLRVIILPEAGAKIWQITYKPLDADLLWNNPRVPPARLPLNSRYDDVWCGGGGELFPDDEGLVIEREIYPDHGEVLDREGDFHSLAYSGGKGGPFENFTPSTFNRGEENSR